MTEFDLQLFADMYGAGEEDDNPTEADEPIKTVNDDDDDDDVDLKALLGGDEEDEDTEEEPEEEPEEPEEEPTGRVYTEEEHQAELDRVLRSRLAREQEKYQDVENFRQKVREVEKASGMKIDEVLETIIANRTQAYVDEGMSEEAAKRQIEMEMKYESMEQRAKELDAYMQRMQHSNQYNAGKQAVLNKNPLYRKYEAEIDQFTNYGAVPGLTFEAAAKFIIGQKFIEGDLAENIRKGAEARALANKGARIEGGTTPRGQKKTPSLSSFERQAAKRLGLSEKEWAESKTKLNKKKR